MSENVQLATGQTARLEDGTVRVQPRKPQAPHHYRMTLTHPDSKGMPTAASAATYEELLPCLKQLEALDYILLKIDRIEGVQLNA